MKEGKKTGEHEQSNANQNESKAMELKSLPKNSKFQQFELQATIQLKIKAKNLNQSKELKLEP